MIKSGLYTYYVDYYYAGGGVISYNYREVLNEEKAKEYATNAMGFVVIAGATYLIIQTGGAAAPVLLLITK